MKKFLLLGLLVCSLNTKMQADLPLIGAGGVIGGASLAVIVAVQKYAPNIHPLLVYGIQAGIFLAPAVIIADQMLEKDKDGSFVENRHLPFLFGDACVLSLGQGYLLAENNKEFFLYGTLALLTKMMFSKFVF